MKAALLLSCLLLAGCTIHVTRDGDVGPVQQSALSPTSTAGHDVIDHGPRGLFGLNETGVQGDRFVVDVSIRNPTNSSVTYNGSCVGVGPLSHGDSENMALEPGVHNRQSWSCASSRPVDEVRFYANGALAANYHPRHC